MLVHSECGGELLVDTSARTEVIAIPGRGFDLYKGIKCSSCNAQLGLLPNVDSVNLDYIPEEALVDEALSLKASSSGTPDA